AGWPGARASADRRCGPAERASSLGKAAASRERVVGEFSHGHPWSRQFRSGAHLILDLPRHHRAATVGSSYLYVYQFCRLYVQFINVDAALMFWELRQTTTPRGYGLDPDTLR